MELWTPEHAKTLLPAVALMLVIGVVLRRTIGKKDIKIRRSEEHTSELQSR